MPVGPKSSNCAQLDEIRPRIPATRAMSAALVDWVTAEMKHGRALPSLHRHPAPTTQPVRIPKHDPRDLSRHRSTSSCSAERTPLRAGFDNNGHLRFRFPPCRSKTYLVPLCEILEYAIVTAIGLIEFVRFETGIRRQVDRKSGSLRAITT